MIEKRIDINCDIGEFTTLQAPHQIELLDYISSCNIATGFHAGDPHTISTIIQEAHRRGVAIGAHPSYPDRKGFGRVSIDITPEELYAGLLYQVSAISGMCANYGAPLHHIKLHGALYHDAHHREEVAEVVGRLFSEWPQPCILYGQANSALEELARQKGIGWVSEGFIDRRYLSDGSLSPRSADHSVITEPDEAIEQALCMIREHRLKTMDGHEVRIYARSLCIHSDHAGSLVLACQLKEKLTSLGIIITPPNP